MTTDQTTQPDMVLRTYTITVWGTEEILDHLAGALAAQVSEPGDDWPDGFYQLVNMAEEDARPPTPAEKAWATRRRRSGHDAAVKAWATRRANQ